MTTPHQHEAWQMLERDDGGFYCGACGEPIPTTDPATDVRPPVPEPEPVRTAEHTQLQVFMVHDVVIDAFKRWVTENGWELKLIPRFAEDDDTYVRTHMIVPKNLGALMRERAAEHRRSMGNAEGS